MRIAVCIGNGPACVHEQIYAEIIADLGWSEFRRASRTDVLAYMRISPQLHGIIDYLVVVFLWLSPALFGRSKRLQFLK